MLNYSLESVTISLFFDNRRKTVKGTYPLKIRVTYRGERKYYPTGKSLSPEDWKKLPTSRLQRFKDNREDIEKSFSVIKKHVQQLTSDNTFSFYALNKKLGRNTGDTINDGLRLRIELLKAEARIGTMMFYQNVLKNVEQFGGVSVRFENITVEWLKKFEKHLLKTKNHTTVSMVMRGVRTMMNEAKKKGIIKEIQYPFGKDRYEIKISEGRKKALTLQQISKVVKFKDGTTTTRMYRDIWFFMYLCNGINAADLVNLKFKDIVDGEICFIRQKTANTSKKIKEIRAVITPEMQSIIDKWGNKKKPDNFIFPLIEYHEDPFLHKLEVKNFIKKINTRTKMIGHQLKIGAITSYTARHSYATVLKRSGSNIAYISESLGHSSLKTTESYLASFEKEERLKNASLLTQF